MPRAAPVTREGWHKFYVQQYDKYGRPILATLALWHLIQFLAFGETPMNEINEQTKKELGAIKKPSMFASAQRAAGIRDSWKA